MKTLDLGKVVGDTGPKGAAGADGYSPTVSLARVDEGVRITVTNKSGTQTATVYDGEDGADGSAGGGEYVKTSNVLSTIEDVQASTNLNDIVGASALKEQLASANGTLIPLLSGGTCGQKKCYRKNGICEFVFQHYGLSGAINVSTPIASFPEGFYPLEGSKTMIGYAIVGSTAIAIPFSVRQDGNLYQIYSSSASYAELFVSGCFVL